MLEFPVIPAIVTRRPFRNVEAFRVALAVHHPCATDWTFEVLECELTELLIVVIGDAARTVDRVVSPSLPNVTLASGAFERRWRTISPPHRAVISRRCGFSAREVEFIGSLTSTKWCYHQLNGPFYDRTDSGSETTHYEMFVSEANKPLVRPKL